MNTEPIVTQLPMATNNFKFLIADLEAAAFCGDVVDEPDDRVIGRKFLSIHQFFLRSIDRERPEIFAGVSRARLVDLVRGWMRLYLHALAELRERFPRTGDSADLVMDGRNWSELFEISFEGLDRLDIPSRYAEFWAERSIRHPEIEASYDARYRMIGSPRYVEHDMLMRSRQLLIVDDFTNGVPAYDLLCAMRELCNPGELENSFLARRWWIHQLTPRARESLVSWIGV